MDMATPSDETMGLDHLQRQVKDMVQRFCHELDCCVEEHFLQLQLHKQASMLDASRHPFALPQEEAELVILPSTPPKQEQRGDPPSKWEESCEEGSADVAWPASPGHEENHHRELVGPARVRSKASEKRSIKLLSSPSALAAMFQQQSSLKKITTSNYFEWVGGTLILLNAAFIGIQTEWEAVEAQRRASAGLPQLLELPSGFFALRAIFSIAFLVELCMRWLAEGCTDFFKGEDVGWNLFDAVIVGLGTIDLLTEAIIMALGSESESPLSSFSVLRVLRLIRIVRVVRIIRVMRFFRELRMMILSILGCVKSMVWILIILVGVFYLFGISFVQAVIAHLRTSEDWTDPANMDLIKYFGTIESSILTLFQAMSGGNDWGVFFDCLLRVSLWYGMLFIFYILFAVFAVVNIVTGVFVDSATQSGRSDKEVVIHEQLQTRKEYMKDVTELFRAMDVDGNGTLTKAEFEKCMRLDTTRALFKAMKLDAREAARLFDLIDCDCKGSVTIDEFITGCFDLQGEATAFDSKVMQVEVRYIKDSMSLVCDMLKELATQPRSTQKILIPGGNSQLQSPKAGLKLS